MSRVHAVFYPGEVMWRPVLSPPPVEPNATGGSTWLAKWRQALAPRPILAALRTFYRDRIAWLALLTTSIVVCYGGGALMFWYHAVALGEGGPAISWYAHWLLDSTFAFIGLTPALFLIIPFAAWAADRLAGADTTRIPWLYTAIAAGLFSLATVPGPIAHDMIVGRGTWIANQITALVGDPSASLTPVRDYPPVVEMSQQLGAAVPTYLVSVAVSLLVVRMIAMRRRRAVAVERQALDMARRGGPVHPG
jgi:hypothetical protein